MADYTKLVNALRVEPFEVESEGLAKVMNDAADAIEELQQIADNHEQAAKDYWKEACEYKAQLPKRGEWNNHEVACLLAEMFGDDCACNLNGIDEWLPQYCEFAETCCPNPVGVACWEQFLKHRAKMEVQDGENES